MVRPRFRFVLLVSFSTFVAAQFEEAAGDFGPANTRHPLRRRPRAAAAAVCSHPLRRWAASLRAAASSPRAPTCCSTARPSSRAASRTIPLRGRRPRRLPRRRQRRSGHATCRSRGARRQPAPRAAVRHQRRPPAFLVEAGRRALTVMGEFPLVASDFDADGEFSAVNEDSGATTTVKDRLWAQLTALQANASAFAALTIWAVGSELNAEWAGLLCGPASAFAPCPFDHPSNTTDLYEKVRARAPPRSPTATLALTPPPLRAQVDELCGVVQSFGLLCVSLLAEVASPAVNASGVTRGPRSSSRTRRTWARGRRACTAAARSVTSSRRTRRRRRGRSSSPSLASTRRRRRPRRRGGAGDVDRRPPPSSSQLSHECAGAVDGAGPDGAVVLRGGRRVGWRRLRLRRRLGARCVGRRRRALGRGRAAGERRVPRPLARRPLAVWRRRRGAVGVGRRPHLRRRHQRRVVRPGWRRAPRLRRRCRRRRDASGVLAAARCGPRTTRRRRR